MRLGSGRELAFLVARRRKELGLTQEQLARRAGIRRATLADLERGGTTPSFTTAMRLLAALDLVLEVSSSTMPEGPADRRVATPRRPSLDDVLARVRE